MRRYSVKLNFEFKYFMLIRILDSYFNPVNISRYPAVGNFIDSLRSPKVCKYTRESAQDAGGEEPQADEEWDIPKIEQVLPIQARTKEKGRQRGQPLKGALSREKSFLTLDICNEH